MPQERLEIAIDDKKAVRGARNIRRSLDDIATGALAAAKSVTGLELIFSDFSGRLIRESVRSFADFERGLIGVGKTTGLAGAQLQALDKNIRRTAREAPVATSELLEIAEAAGKVGVSSRDDIARFTETIGQLGLAMGLASRVAQSTAGGSFWEVSKPILSTPSNIRREKSNPA